jgi:alkylation response protein AidB-like acyl-CoA dehydrogenase
MTIPEEYGGHGFGITEATLLAEEVAKAGGGMNAASSIHLSIFGMHPVVVHGSDELKARTLPRVATGELHVCFGVTEPNAGLDTSRITTSPSATATTMSSTAEKCGFPKRSSHRRSCFSLVRGRMPKSPRRRTV